MNVRRKLHVTMLIVMAPVDILHLWIEITQSVHQHLVTKMKIEFLLFIIMLDYLMKEAVNLPMMLYVESRILFHPEEKY